MPIPNYSHTLATRPKSNSVKYFVCDVKEGNYDKVIRDCQAQLKNNPQDLEAYFGLTVAYAQKNDLDSSFFYFDKAIDAGMPFERFLVGPRNLLQPLSISGEFKNYLQVNPVELLHGPMLGDVTHNSAQFWIRTRLQCSFEIRLYGAEKMDKPIITKKGKTSKDRDFTGSIKITGLKPDTRYFYEVLINDKVVSNKPRPAFRTYPAKKTKTSFKIAFGGGSNNIPKNEGVWDTILSRQPLAFLFLGDNTYFNIADVPEHQRYFFYQRLSRPEFRRLAAATAIYAIYDDHDFGGNDSIGGPLINKPAWKKNVTWRIFKENFLNPYYGGGNKQPGCWFDFSIGDVDFFMLDGRYYRTDPPRARNRYIPILMLYIPAC